MTPCSLEVRSKFYELRAIWNFSKVPGLPQIDMGHKGPVNLGVGASGPWGLDAPNLKSINKSKFMSKFKVTMLDYRVLQPRQPQYEKNKSSWRMI